MFNLWIATIFVFLGAPYAHADLTNPTSLSSSSVNSSMATMNRAAQAGSARQSVSPQSERTYSFAENRICSEELLQQMKLDPTQSIRIVVHKNDLGLEKLFKSALFIFSVCSDQGCVEIERRLSKDNAARTNLLSVANNRWACQIAATKPESRYFRFAVYTWEHFRNWYEPRGYFDEAVNQISLQDLRKSPYLVALPLAQGSFEIGIAIK